METPNTKFFKEAAIAGWSPSLIFATFADTHDEANKKRSSNFQENHITPSAPPNKVADAKVTPALFKFSNKNVISFDIENLTQNFDAQNLNNCKSTNSNSELVQAALLDEPLHNGWYLFEHQKDAVRCCLNSRRVILAYDMGLGKTLIESPTIRRFSPRAFVRLSPCGPTFCSGIR